MHYFFVGFFSVFAFLPKEKKLPPTASDHKFQVLILQLQLISFIIHNFNVMH